MEDVKITFFRDKKITRNNPGALIEFSTGETKVVTHRNIYDFGYYLNKTILDVIRIKKESDVFKNLSE